ncbi:hypothetical protein T484DRAFT_2578739 [Baffinella frigidus]|nr:hypothetical protein T484DRAFT_2578739 [Cryptophyta sp. CCMP2293]
MQESKPFIVDGSLSNVDWYQEYFDYIRRNFPQYRIGIVHVVCDREVIFERVQRRCLETGRCISMTIVDLSVEMTPAAVRKLAPSADFVVVADSTEENGGELLFTHIIGKGGKQVPNPAGALPPASPLLNSHSPPPVTDFVTQRLQFPSLNPAGVPSHSRPEEGVF